MAGSPGFEDIVLGARLLWQLPSFLRNPIDSEQASRILGQRLRHREDHFLELVKKTIYEDTGNPYLELLTHAGCDYSAMEELVRRDGIEAALHEVLRHGVYLTVDEYKGRCPVVRGSKKFQVDPNRLRNPLSLNHLAAITGGSRSGGTVVPMDLAWLFDWAVDTCLAFTAYGGTHWRHAIWGIPGSTDILRVLVFAKFGSPIVRWFSQVDLRAPEMHPRYRWSVTLMRCASVLSRVPLPVPEHVPLAHPSPIIEWIHRTVREGATPHLITSVSAAVHLCQAAVRAGVDISGMQFTVSGEPLTEARIAQITGVAGRPLSFYATIETGRLGYACLAPEAPDDVHLANHLHALIQPGSIGNTIGLSANSILLSSLRPTAPIILLNVSTGDDATLEERACHCPVERIGWRRHLRHIRSWEKLTAGGMTFIDTDVIRVLEEVLPSRFGGVPTDYQLVESEDEDGRPCITLLVNPSLGPLDHHALTETFLRSISEPSAAQGVMGILWRNAGFLKVERKAPFVTPSGKILHIHVESKRE